MTPVVKIGGDLARPFGRPAATALAVLTSLVRFRSLMHWLRQARGAA